MKAIVAVNNLGFIGKDNELPWRCKQDLIHFKNMTKDSVCLAGYNTRQTLPPLKGRRVVGEEYKGQIDWCIGGKKTYEKHASEFTELHISHIDDNTIGDVTFPNLININPKCKIFNYLFISDGIETKQSS